MKREVTTNHCKPVMFKLLKTLFGKLLRKLTGRNAQLASTKVKPATYIGNNLTVTTFTCRFEGDGYASGYIAVNGGPMIQWEARLFGTTWHFHPTDGRSRFALNSSDDRKISRYIQKKVLERRDFAFGEDKTQRPSKKQDLMKVAA